MPTYRFSE